MRCCSSGEAEEARAPYERMRGSVESLSDMKGLLVNNANYILLSVIEMACTRVYLLLKAHINMHCHRITSSDLRLSSAARNE